MKIIILLTLSLSLISCAGTKLETSVTKNTNAKRGPSSPENAPELGRTSVMQGSNIYSYSRPINMNPIIANITSSDGGPVLTRWRMPEKIDRVWTAKLDWMKIKKNGPRSLFRTIKITGAEEISLVLDTGIIYANINHRRVKIGQTTSHLFGRGETHFDQGYILTWPVEVKDKEDQLVFREPLF